MWRYATALCLLVAASACAGEPEGPPPEPAVEIGRIIQGEFESYQPGDHITAMTSLQAGIWLMPALRFTGMTGKPDINCIVLCLDRDQVFAEANGFIVSKDFGDGWQTISPFMMEVVLPDDEVEDYQELVDYEDDRVLVECTAVDELGIARTASHEMTVALN